MSSYDVKTYPAFAGYDLAEQDGVNNAVRRFSVACLSGRPSVVPTSMRLPN